MVFNSVWLLLLGSVESMRFRFGIWRGKTDAYAQGSAFQADLRRVRRIDVFWVASLGGEQFSAEADGAVMSGVCGRDRR